ncbi:hypothetical protein [Streptomyces sp. 3N207]|uniref:hypothetical protein n=1 Tax=Streptomyces sp. 3N207 TaxID=3457417 RepID=UPI003FD0978B
MAWARSVGGRLDEPGGHPHLDAAAPQLREVTSAQLFEEELAVLIRAIESVVRPECPE